METLTPSELRVINNVSEYIATSAFIKGESNPELALRNMLRAIIRESTSKFLAIKYEPDFTYELPRKFLTRLDRMINKIKSVLEKNSKTLKQNKISIAETYTICEIQDATDNQLCKVEECIS